ncbi:putative septum site-determining protein MinC [Candidatus Electronema halotolerans]
MDRTAGRNDSRTAFDLKGAAFTILVLSLRSADMEEVAALLKEKVRQAPDFFHNAPVVISLGQVEEETIDLATLINLLRNQGFIPVGITCVTDEQKAQAAAMELAVLTARGAARPVPEEAAVAEPEPEDSSAAVILPLEQPPAAQEQHVFVDPVRSGQSVIIAHGDLTVLASVGSGAEIAAPGSIHVYGTLRGRAFAGCDGDATARIFCQKLEAELVAIAGVHLVSEDFPNHLRSKPAQIRLHGGRLHVTGL